MIRKKSDKEGEHWVWPDSEAQPILGATGVFGNTPAESGGTFEKLSENEGPGSEIPGSLSLFAVRDPKSFFSGMKEPEGYLHIDLSGDEWASLFLEELNCPTAAIEPYSADQDLELWRERYKLRFQEAIPTYPMLGRISDFYDYTSYGQEEIAQLREECLRIQGHSNNEKTLRALAKLLEGCNQVSRVDLGLLLVPD